MKLIKIIDISGRYIASSSFSFGTVLIIWYYCFPKYELIITIGTYYIAIAFYTNTITLFITLSAALIYTRYRSRLFKVIGLLLLNIPIAIFYFILVLVTINF